MVISFVLIVVLIRISGGCQLRLLVDQKAKLQVKCEFESISYFHRHYKPKAINSRISILGFDSEADNTGKSFMFAISDNTVIQAAELFETLFQHKYRGIAFVVYNL